MMAIERIIDWSVFNVFGTLLWSPWAKKKKPYSVARSCAPGCEGGWEGDRLLVSVVKVGGNIIQEVKRRGKSRRAPTNGVREVLWDEGQVQNATVGGKKKKSQAVSFRKAI